MLHRHGLYGMVTGPGDVLVAPAEDGGVAIQLLPSLALRAGGRSPEVEPYIAPELLAQQKDFSDETQLTPAADLYTAGALLYFGAREKEWLVRRRRF